MASQLGAGALIWPSPGDRPLALWPLLEPASRPRGRVMLTESGGVRRRVGEPSIHLPAAVGHLYQTDLFLGGATVAHSPAVDLAFAELDLLAQRSALAAPTAWLATTVKWRYRAVTGGQGLHLGIETTYGGAKRLHSGPESVRRIGKDGMPVVTLPLDGDFVFALRQAYWVLETTVGDLPRRPHPKHLPGRWQTGLAAELYEQRGTPAAQLARRLLDSQAGLAEVVTVPRASVPVGDERVGLLVPVPRDLSRAA